MRWRPLVRQILTVLLVGAVGSVCFAIESPSASANRERALELVRVLENEPDTESASAAFAWLLQWLVEVPDLEVRVCLDVLGDGESLEGLPPTIVMHPAFGQAAYQIRHPEASPGSLKVLLAGVESTLRSYESRKRDDEDLSIPVLEKLLEKRGQGSLEKYVKKRRKICTRRGM